ncbi:putative leucine-rich repeat domain superfamily [Plasmopara halstedii]
MTRRLILDEYQRFLSEVRVMHRNGKFSSSQGELIVQRVREFVNGNNNALDLSGFLIPDKFIDLLAAFLRSKTCKVEALTFSRTLSEVSTAICIARSTNSAIRTLQFSTNPISIESIQFQAATSGNVIISGQNYNHVDVAAIGIILERECKHLLLLDLSENPLTGPKANNFHGITFMFECLKKCQLQELNLHHTNLRSDGIVAFANAIEDYPALKKLDLGWNQLTLNSTEVAGVESLCNVLWRIRTLREISLVGNELDYHSATFITEMLKVNCTIESLTLAQNPLGDAGVIAIAAALRKNTALLSLNLSDCKIGCDGLNELAMTLQKFNRTLRTLDVTDNPDVRSRGYLSLVKSISINYTIVEICMNPVSKYKRFLSEVKEYLAVNALLSTVQIDPKGFVGFPVLTETQRSNFVDKLEKFNESELRLLHDEGIMEKAVRFSDEKEAAGLATLRHYAAIEKYASLKRLLWCFEVGRRHKQLEKRSKLSNDDDDVWNYPLI